MATERSLSRKMRGSSPKVSPFHYFTIYLVGMRRLPASLHSRDKLPSDPLKKKSPYPTLPMEGEGREGAISGEYFFAAFRFFKNLPARRQPGSYQVSRPFRRRTGFSPKVSFPRLKGTSRSFCRSTDPRRLENPRPRSQTSR